MGVKLAEPIKSFNHDVSEDRWGTVARAICALDEIAKVLIHFWDAKVLVARFDPNNTLPLSVTEEQKLEFSFCLLVRESNAYTSPPSNKKVVNFGVGGSARGREGVRESARECENINFLFALFLVRRGGASLIVDFGCGSKA